MRKWFKKARIVRKLTQQDLADICNVSQNSIASYEIGTRTPRPKSAMKIAKVLGVDWTKFYE